MATNFWESSHCKRWILDEATLRQARAIDAKYFNPRELSLIGIFFANLIAKLGKRLNFRQQVIATATVFFKRFYTKSSYVETDPFFVASTCCYVAGKAEETPVYLKAVVTESRTLFSSYGVRNFPTDHSKVAEMEFYLLEDIEFHLVVFHPYRSLAALCGKLGVAESAEAGEVGADPDEERYWGTGEGSFPFDDGCVQMAWFVINDSFRGDFCLLYPPYIIAIASLYLSVLLHGNTRAKLSDGTEDPIGRRTRSAGNAPAVSIRERLLDFLSGLNVSLETVSRVCQQMLNMYALWDNLADGSEGDEKRRNDRKLPGSASGLIPLGSEPKNKYLEKDLVMKLSEKRIQRESDLAHPPDGQPAVNHLMDRISVL